ncbi:8586_t:CDS:2, partial [Gigaspora rosea]
DSYFFDDHHATSPINEIPTTSFVEPSYNYQTLQNQLDPQQILHHSMFLEESQLMNENQNEIDEIDDQDDTNSSDKENDELYIGQSFKTWEEAEKHLNNYEKKRI